jgi:ribosomal protein L21
MIANAAMLPFSVLKKAKQSKAEQSRKQSRKQSKEKRAERRELNRVCV